MTLRLDLGDELPEVHSRSRSASLRFLRRVHPGYKFKLELPRDRCRRDGVFDTFVPIVIARRWCPR